MSLKLALLLMKTWLGGGSAEIDTRSRSYLYGAIIWASSERLKLITCIGYSQAVWNLLICFLSTSQDDLLWTKRQLLGHFST